jgi:hypothetical protein
MQQNSEKIQGIVTPERKRIFYRLVVWSTLDLLAIALVLLALAVVPVQAQGPNGYDLTWWTVDSGGETGQSSNGYTLLSTIGQPDADAVNGGEISGGNYTLRSGFWPGEKLLGPTTVYLPLILKSPLPALPDLVGSFTLSPANPTSNSDVTVTAVITNQGTLTADAFWVDFYVNPTQTPTVNKRWNDICQDPYCIGIAWFVEAGLQPGQSVTLTSNSFPGDSDEKYSIWNDSLPAGTTELYLLVDSWNPTVTAGGVFESDETNNLSSMTGLNITGLGISSQSSGIVIAPRPAPGFFNPEVMSESQSLPPTSTPASTPTLIPPTATPFPDTPTATATLAPVDTITPAATTVITTSTPVSSTPAVTNTATVTVTVPNEPAPATPETTGAEP